MTLTQLPIPAHFDPSKVEQVWKVDYEGLATAAEAYAAQHQLPAAANDDVVIELVVIDGQNTFCLPDFELFVGGRDGRGAIDDNIRLCEFIYRELGVITRISPTLDTHTATQIFHAVFWVDEQGNHPVGGATVIELDDIVAGRWKVNPRVAGTLGVNYVALQRHAEHYARQLTDGGKYPLMVWPYHGMLGGIGHALVSSVEEACFFHNLARGSQTDFQVKGGNPLTENYSVLGPEVTTSADGAIIAQSNVRFIERLLRADVVIVAGQAKSHCVKNTIDDLLTEIVAQDPELARKVYLLEDCTSPVVIPGVVDFTDQADEAFERFAAAGMHVVQSTTPIADWPDVQL